VGLKATHCLADFVRELKKTSSVWTTDHHDRYCQWQAGYSAFTVSPTHRHPRKGYIAAQEEHHRTLSFVDKLKQLLERNGVEWFWHPSRVPVDCKCIPGVSRARPPANIYQPSGLRRTESQSRRMGKFWVVTRVDGVS
jgi:hypothetical protein